jgi:hypothetical protein
MSRTCVPFSVGDISAFARSLRTQLAALDRTPGHVELLHMLARAAGHRNFQALRAMAAAFRQLESRYSLAEPVDPSQVLRLSRFFDASGRLASWPAKASLQSACLWVIWSRLPAGRTLTEDELNRELRASHLFGDHALLRRELCNHQRLSRTADGREYRRVEVQPPQEALALIRQMGRSQDGFR